MIPSIKNLFLTSVLLRVSAEPSTVSSNGLLGAATVPAITSHACLGRLQLSEPSCSSV